MEQVELLLSKNEIFENACHTHNELQLKLYELEKLTTRASDQVAVNNFIRSFRTKPEAEYTSEFNKLTPWVAFLAYTQIVNEKTDFYFFHRKFGARIVEIVEQHEVERDTKIAKANLNFYLINVNLRLTSEENLYSGFCKLFPRSAPFLSKEMFCLERSNRLVTTKALPSQGA